jgi:hypothetical protein
MRSSDSFPYRFLAVVTSILFAGCAAEINVDLAGSWQEGAEGVVLQITGVEFIKDGGDLESASSSNGRNIDLTRIQDTVGLLSGAELATGRYTGVRLRHADSGAYVSRSDGGVAAIQISELQSFADIDIDLGESDEADLVLTLELPFSLIDRVNENGSFELRPFLRAVRPEDGGHVEGSVDIELLRSAECRQERQTGEGVAVYAYEGRNVQPTDFQIGHFGPLASAAVERGSSDTDFRYRIRHLPHGGYTIALSCEADRDDPRTADGIAFLRSQNVSIDRESTRSSHFVD